MGSEVVKRLGSTYESEIPGSQYKEDTSSENTFITDK